MTEDEGKWITLNCAFEEGYHATDDVQFAGLYSIKKHVIYCTLAMDKLNIVIPALCTTEQATERRQCLWLGQLVANEVLHVETPDGVKYLLEQLVREDMDMKNCRNHKKYKGISQAAITAIGGKGCDACNSKFTIACLAKALLIAIK